MKISFVLITTSLAGGVRYVFEVANGLKNRGYNVKILSLAGDHSWFKGLKVEVVYKEPIMNKISKTLYNLHKVYKLIKLNKSKIKPYNSILAFNSLLGIKSNLITELAEFIQNFRF